MTTLATTSSLRKAITPEAFTRARRRLLTAEPNPTSSNTPTSGSLTDDQLRNLAASDWAPPRIPALDASTIATADPITRALLAESVCETLERRLAAERPHGTSDDTRAGHDAFSRTVTDDYDHGNHHLARAAICPADPGLVTRAALSALGLPDTDATIIDELAQASDPNPLTRVLADAALLDLDRYATGRGLRYSRVGTALMLTAPNEQRLADAIDAVAASSKTRPVTAHAQATPSTQVRNLLRASRHRLTKRQQERLREAFTADEAHISVEVAYLLTQQVREVFHQDTPAHGRRLAAHLIQRLPACPIPEIARLGRTLRKWKDAFLAYFDTDGASNGPTEAINGHYRTRQTHRQRLPQPHQLPTPNAPHRRRPRCLHPHSTMKSRLSPVITAPSA